VRRALLIMLLASPGFAQDDQNAPAGFEDWDDDWGDTGSAVAWTGFIETALGRRLDGSVLNEDETLGDLRARIETEWSGDVFRLTFKGEALYDDVESSGEGDLRELNFLTSPGDALDIKLGRQVLTWGTGDLLFLNDLFPKSWVSFFAGRDDEYLKAPSDAVRVTWYRDFANLDFVWTPEFEPDDYLTGVRFSFFSPLARDIVAPRPPLAARTPEDDVGNGEFALRIFRTAGSTEYALYLYRGFFKRPLGLSETSDPLFPPLAVYGASLRRPLANGLFNAELAYHDSRDDSAGTNPLVPNDQLRVLLGFEFEAAARFNVGFQYYLEWTQDYEALLASSPARPYEPDEHRHVLTSRLTYRLDQDRLTLSLFGFYSPSDRDYYLRPVMSFRYSDYWTLTGGANLFGGDDRHTFFGQLEDNSNAYFRARFSF
jgi:hypothetical protein